MTLPERARPALVVVGPTASGKTSLAIQLAETFAGEIISADSMQIYRGMEIGTAAPTHAEQARVPHHLIGILEPSEPFSAGEFSGRAQTLIDEIRRRDHLPVIVGGSGLYVRAVIDGLHSGPTRDPELRKLLGDEAETRGLAVLFERLTKVDAAYAAQIGPNDLRRIVRALEVYELTGRPYSEHHEEHQASLDPMPSVWLGIDVPRPALYQRIDERVDAMIEAGFESEVKRLVDAGYTEHLERIRTLGYVEFLAYFRGEQTRDEAIEHMKQNTRRFAKRQLTWFRAEKRIQWLAAGDSLFDVAQNLYRAACLSTG